MPLPPPRRASIRVGLVVPVFGMVPALPRHSDMIAMLPSRIVAAGLSAAQGLAPAAAKDMFLRHVAALTTLICQPHDDSLQTKA